MRGSPLLAGLHSSLQPCTGCSVRISKGLPGWQASLSTHCNCARQAMGHLQWLDSTLVCLPGMGLVGEVTVE